jgi:hypothetical protein
MEKLDNKSLCLSLMKANSEDRVIEVLKENGYWDDPNCWRYYGDKENNYSAAGNQADEAEAALVEKITNARDAILMNECMLRGIDPRSEKAPSGVRAAVAEFFESNPKSELAGQIREWDKAKRRVVAKLMSVYLTGPGPRDSYPSVNIADKGEGQTPLRIPETILSLGESIKRNIRFVHGKWNMGGTAALVYCGKRNLQFVLSRRNPSLQANSTNKKESDANWGFTVVRREDPQGLITSSTYKYLAPIGIESNPTKGDLLSFISDTMPIFAEYNKPYFVESELGTLIKLYEYETSYRQNVQGNGGLLRPLDLLAPDLGLPFRLHECRYEGDPGSFEHQVNGLRVRLHDQADKVLEPSYPTYHNPEIEGERISIAVYAFKEDKAKNYRDNDKGCVFVLNGQSQGWIDDRLFTRNKVGLGFIKNSLLVMVDCSEMTYRGQERLFVNDRVHMKRGTDFFDKIESEIVDYLANHKGLAELQEERKRKLRTEKVGDDKPLEAVLANVFRSSSALSRIFLRSEKLSNAFKSDGVASTREPFIGVQYPTHFKFKKLDYGETLRRETHVGARARIIFETDAENDYFNRKTNPGSYGLYMFDLQGEPYRVKDDEATYGLNLFNGVGTLNINFSPKYKEGDLIWLMLEVTDPLRIVNPPFQNKFALDVMPEVANNGGKNHQRHKNPDKIPGKDQDKPSGVKFPKIELIYEKDWGKLESFNKYSAMHVAKSKSTTPEENIEFTFYVNMDNIYLQHEIKADVESKVELEAYFKYGMALLGISVIYDDQQNKPENDRFEDIERRISEYSRAMGPIIIPMIKEFHNLDLKDELIKELAS